MNIKERLSALRAQMEERGMDAYIIPTSDFHETEYVGDHFKAREYMSNFSGSAGSLVVCKEEAGLWTDGRYFIQAAKQLEHTGITLMKMGEEGTPLMAQYVVDHMRVGGAIGFDGRVINTTLAEAFQAKIKEKQGAILCEEDLVGMIWEDRPALPCEKAFALDVKFCGQASSEKLAKVREKMKEVGCDVHIVASLDDIAWLLNMRGNDIPSFPVALAYVIISQTDAKVCIDKSKLSDELLAQFAQDNVSVYPYEDIYTQVKSIPSTSVVMLDKATVNFKITNTLVDGVEIKNMKNPSQLWKAIKNQVELENNRKAHIKDGVAVTNFMYWLKTNIGKMEISEVSAADYLEECRRAQEGFIEVSFDTISAYNENAAMMHYHATSENCATLRPQGLLLVDSGGQYFEGTTDITRTFALGPISDNMRKHFTLVLRGMMNLSRAKFLYGCSGMNLDILARGVIWNEDLDYKCGTGHGIGFLLNVHEGPNGFRWKKVVERNDSGTLEAGMVTTIEPGVYLEGEYGIRSENELVAQYGVKNEYGQFMQFETITFAPFDLDAIDPAYLSKDEIAWLNACHQEVYEKISPYLNEEVKAWLKEYTRAI